MPARLTSTSIDRAVGGAGGLVRPSGDADGGAAGGGGEGLLEVLIGVGPGTAVVGTRGDAGVHVHVGQEEAVLQRLKHRLDGAGEEPALCGRVAGCGRTAIADRWHM